MYECLTPIGHLPPGAPCNLAWEDTWPRRRPPAGARRRDLRETLERIPVDVVVAVDWLEHPDLGDRFHLRSGFLDRLREVASSRTVVVLSVDGTLRAYGPFPTPDDVDRAVRLSILIGAATAALVGLARR